MSVHFRDISQCRCWLKLMSYAFHFDTFALSSILKHCHNTVCHHSSQFPLNLPSLIRPYCTLIADAPLFTPRHRRTVDRRKMSMSGNAEDSLHQEHRAHRLSASPYCWHLSVLWPSARADWLCSAHAYRMEIGGNSGPTGAPELGSTAVRADCRRKTGRQRQRTFPHTGVRPERRDATSLLAKPKASDALAVSDTQVCSPSHTSTM
jgi:hypothetical protein